MDGVTVPYYRPDLALVHHLGFGGHADACAPGILTLLQPVHRRGGLVVELGCGSGRLTRHLVDAGHRVVATDASPAMLDLTRRHVPEAEDIRRLALPDDELPAADAVVSVGHVLNYLPDEESLERALVSAARALLPGGLLLIDLCDLAWGELRRDAPNQARLGDDWAVVTQFDVPSPDRFVRRITTFLRRDDGLWRRDDERHENVLIETAAVPGRLRQHGIDAELAPAFGTEALPVGLVAVTGWRRPLR